MRARTLVHHKTHADAGYEVSQFALQVGMGMAALVGIWGATCLIGGMAIVGLGGLVNGLISAIVVA